MIRRGNCAPVTAFELPFADPVPDGFGLCRLYGEVGVGAAATVAAPFQRLAVSEDGATVVFEVTDDVTLVPSLRPVQAEEEGLYWVRADGSGLRRLGAASRLPRWLGIPDPKGPLLGLRVYVNTHADFDRRGRRLAFSDLGPGPSGEEAPQIFVLDLESGARRQLTSLPRPTQSSGLGSADLGPPEFIDDDTIVFYSTAALADEVPPATPRRRAFLVRVDGTDLHVLPSPEALPSGDVLEDFRILGRRRAIPSSVRLPDGNVELVVARANGNVLQLTNLHATDLRWEAMSPGADRILFIVSADPLGTNRSRNCQIFSIGTLGNGLRQLTHFGETEHATSGCDFTLPRSGCGVATVLQDVATREVVFYSTCDPFGSNAAGGAIFSMRPGGTALRQLTSTRGLVLHDDGSVTAELPGPWAYSSRW